MRPLRRQRLHAVSRRAEALTLGLDDPLPLRVNQGLDLLVLFGRAKSADELPAVQARLQAYPGEGPVVVGVPLQAGGDLPFSAYRWLYRGYPLQLPPNPPRRQFYEALLRRLYHDSPGPWRANRATAWKALDYLTDFGAELWLPIEPPARPERSRSLVALLQQALVRPGLLRPSRTSGNTALYELSQGQPERAEGRMFAELLARLYRTGQQSLGEVLNWLAEAPRGLRGLPAWIYLAAALRCHSQDVSLASGGESFPLTRESFHQAVRRPSAWQLFYQPAEAQQQAFADALSRLFETNGHDEALDLWGRARANLQAWWARLPRWTRLHADAHSPNAMTLARLLAADRPVSELPQAFRQPSGPFLLDRLEAAKLELEGHLQGQYDRMSTRIYALFMGQAADPGTSRAWLDRGCREWLAGVPPRSASDDELSPWTLGLRHAITSDASVDKRWFEALPSRLEMAPLAQWDGDYTVVFLARLARARLELELWTVLRTLPLDPDRGKRQQQVAEWIRQTLQSVGLTVPRAEKILFELLEQLYAQET